MSQSVNISGIVLTFNEEKNIARCLQSMQEVCDEIVVVDSFSSDKTEEICKSFGVRFIQNAWPGFKEQKNFAQAHAQYDHVLQLDADEEVSTELQQSILAVKAHWQADGYFSNRFTNYCGKWIRHSGWYPDSKLRLYDRRKGNWQGLDPHPHVILQAGASSGKLKGDLLHYSFYSHEELVTRSAGYAKQAAEAMLQTGKKYSGFKLVFSPVFRFWKDYIFQGGFRDGFEGLVICWVAAYYTFLKYMYLRALKTGGAAS